MQPASTGPMKGDWRPGYMTALNGLIRECNRELDRAQIGAPIPEADPLSVAIVRVLEARET